MRGRLQYAYYMVVAQMRQGLAHLLSCLIQQEPTPMDVDHEGSATITKVKYASVCPECHDDLNLKHMAAANTPLQPGYRSVLPLQCGTRIHGLCLKKHLKRCVSCQQASQVPMHTTIRETIEWSKEPLTNRSKPARKIPTCMAASSKAVLSPHSPEDSLTPTEEFEVDTATQLAPRTPVRRPEVIIDSGCEALHFPNGTLESRFHA
jgi:hypothetical protein